MSISLKSLLNFAVVICLSLSISAFAQNWSLVNPYPTVEDIDYIKFINNNYGIIATKAGNLFHSNNNGIDWNTIPTSAMPSLPITCELFHNGSVWWVNNDLNETTTLYRIQYFEDLWDSLSIYNETQFNICAIAVLDSFSTILAGYQYDNQDSPLIIRITNWTNNPQDESQITFIPFEQEVGLILNDVRFFNENIGIAIGTNGLIKRTTNKGETWENIESPTDINLNTLSVTANGFGWAGGGSFNQQIMLATTNYGLSWSIVQDLPATTQIASISAIDSANAIAVTLGNFAFPPLILKLVNDTWQRFHTVNTENLFSVSAVDTQFWYAGNKGYIGNYQQIEDEDLFIKRSHSFVNGAINVSTTKPDGTVWVGADQGKFLHSTDGSEWNQIQLQNHLNIYALTFPTNDIGIASGHGSTAWRTTNGGENWTQFDINGATVTQLVSNDNSVFAIHGINVSHSDNYGETWTAYQVMQNVNFNILQITSPSAGVAIVSSAVEGLRRTNNNGESWDDIQEFSETYGVCFITNDVGFVVAPDVVDRLRLYYTSNGGDSWIQRGTLPVETPRLKFLDENIGFAYGNNDRIFFTDNGGRNWQEITPTYDSHIRDVLQFDHDRTLIVGTNGILAFWHRYGLSAPYKESNAPIILSNGLLSAYPNPTNGFVSIAYEGFIPAPSNKLIISDLLGRKLSTYGIPYSSSSFTMTLDLSGFPSGVYFIGLSDHSATPTRILLQK